MGFVFFIKESSVYKLMEVEVWGGKMTPPELPVDLRTDICEGEEETESGGADLDDILENEEPMVFKSASESNYEVYWEPDFKSTLSYSKFKSSNSKKNEVEESPATLMSFLMDRGYVDYTLNKAEKDREEMKKAGCGTGEGDPKMNSDVLKDSIRLFQQQNGFAETALVTKDTLDFVKKGRCGNSDVEFSANNDDDEEARCYSLFTNVS
eukprot:sb/3470308/